MQNLSLKNKLDKNVILNAANYKKYQLIKHWRNYNSTRQVFSIYCFKQAKWQPLWSDNLQSIAFHNEVGEDSKLIVEFSMRKVKCPNDGAWWQAIIYKNSDVL